MADMWALVSEEKQNMKPSCSIDKSAAVHTIERCVLELPPFNYLRLFLGEIEISKYV